MARMKMPPAQGQCQSVARRVYAGTIAWAPQGFTAISLPRGSCVTWKSCLARMKIPSAKLPGLLQGVLGVSCTPRGLVLSLYLGVVFLSKIQLALSPTFSLFDKPEKEIQLN